jgi:hypothetical protein
MFALGIFGIGQLEEHGALLSGPGQFALAQAQIARLAVPLDLFVLQQDILARILLDELFLVIAVVERLFTGPATPGQHCLRRIRLLSAERGDRRLYLGANIGKPNRTYYRTPIFLRIRSGVIGSPRMPSFSASSSSTVSIAKQACIHPGST